MEIIASEFKAKCLNLMDIVAKTGEPLVITKHGTAVAKLVPVTNKPRTLFGACRDTVQSHSDLLPPLDSDWSAENGSEDALYE